MLFYRFCCCRDFLIFVKKGIYKDTRKIPKTQKTNNTNCQNKLGQRLALLPLTRVCFFGYVCLLWFLEVRWGLAGVGRPEAREVEDNCCCGIASFFVYQVNWGHCEVEANCCCSEAIVFFYSRLTGGIVKSMMFAVVVGQLLL
jgi:hypothetical protein